MSSTTTTDEDITITEASIRRSSSSSGSVTSSFTNMTTNGNGGGRILPNGDATNSTYDPEELITRIDNHLTRHNISNVEEFVDEMEHQHIKMMEHRLRQQRRFKIRCYSMFAFLVFLALLLVGFGSKLRNHGLFIKKQSPQPQSHGTTMITSTKSSNANANGIVLPSPPADLESKCNIHALSTQQGIQLCESVCELIRML